MKGTDVVEKGFATVDSTGKAWTWTPLKPLPDADYTLKADVVDAAGNPALKGSVTKAVVIDTKGPTDGTDANSGLKTTTIGISTDTAAKGATNSDFVTWDGGNKDKTSAVNDDDKLTFNGILSSGFEKNGGKVWVQIVDMDGKIKSSAYVEPTGTQWTYEHIGALAEGQYVAKTILLDHVGNMISSKDQSFVIDIKSAIYKNIGQSTLNSENIENMQFGEEINNIFIYQYGTYKYGNVIGEYFGGNLNLGIQNGTFFAKGDFKMTFWDQAGNQTDIVNGKDWTFNNASVASLTATSDGAVVPKYFNGGQIIGAVGQFDVPGNFDMASLYDGIDAIADQAAANHIALSDASDVTLTLSMGDVLALGVTNSFSDAGHEGQIQMRIDGQTRDALNLDGLVNGLNLNWVQSSTNFPLDTGSERYDVYTNAALGLALFVDKDITVNVL
jgi:hypothetical protein